MVVVIVDLVDVGVGVLEVVDVNRRVVEWVAGWRSRRREREREREHGCLKSRCIVKTYHRRGAQI